MSTASTGRMIQSVEPKAAPAKSGSPWIINSGVDQLLILLTPLVVTPAVWILYSSWVGVKAETISLIVTAFFATGHHLPSLIRAYGDRDLFERFRWRFILAPPLVFLTYFPLYYYHYDWYQLIILFWATWHGLMQVYGFARIYDAKVGSTSSATAYWDWLLCLCGFITPQFFRPDILSSFLSDWNSAGGPAISPATLTGIRCACLAASIVVLIGFTVNYVLQSYRGPRPSSLKLIVLSTSIGLWWFAMLGVEKLILSIALFDICHDVQYLAIVWLLNCRRVSTNTQLGGFMKYVFRRGMVLLYLGLITAYGAIAMLGTQMLDGTVSKIFYGVLFTSTILHYYYDGFIWKMRESTNQVGFGLSPVKTASRVSQVMSSNVHLMKWSPVIIVLGLLFTSDLFSPPLTTARKTELQQIYGKGLMANSLAPRDEKERSWLFEYFTRSQEIASTVPNDRSARLRAAILLANFGRNAEAIDRLQELIKQFPEFSDAHATLGGIFSYSGNPVQANTCFESALSCAKTQEQRSNVNLKWGEAYFRRGDRTAAEIKFNEAIKDNPKCAISIDNFKAAAAENNR